MATGKEEAPNAWKCTWKTSENENTRLRISMGVQQRLGAGPKLSDAPREAPASGSRVEERRARPQRAEMHETPGTACGGDDEAQGP